MSGVQLSLDADSGLPTAFVDRWRELGGPAVSGESCGVERGHYTFVVVVPGHHPFAFLRRRDPRAVADELFKRVAS